MVIAVFDRQRGFGYLQRMECIEHHGQFLRLLGPERLLSFSLMWPVRKAIGMQSDRTILNPRPQPQLNGLIQPLAGSLPKRSQQPIERAVPVFQVAPDLHRIVGTSCRQ